MEELTIGFLSSAKFENDSVIRGAILVTDVETKPLEFRVTAPVRPTNFQKTLYGDILRWPPLFGQKTGYFTVLTPLLKREPLFKLRSPSISRLASTFALLTAMLRCTILRGW